LVYPRFYREITKVISNLRFFARRARMRREPMQSQSTAHEGGKRRSQRSSDVLQDYLKGLDSEHASLVAQREYVQARLELVERQRANLQEVIEIEAKLAEMNQRGLGMAETSGEGESQKGEAVVAP